MRRVNTEKHEEKKREILAAARKCFARSGLEGASVADICKAAKISPGHLYHYFPSKEAICEALAAQALQQGADNLRELVGRLGAYAALTTVIESANTPQLRQDFPLMLEFIMAAARNPRLAKALKEHTRRMRQTLTDVLASGQASGFIDPTLDPEAVAALLFSLLDGVRIQISRDPSLEFNKLRDHLKVMVGRFLTPGIKQS